MTEGLLLTKTLEPHSNCHWLSLENQIRSARSFKGQLASDPMYDLLRDAPRVARPLPFVLGAALLRRIKTGRLSAACAVSTATLVTLSTLTRGHIAMWSMLAAGLFNSILFPAILSLGVAQLGCVTGNGSGILNMAIIGGSFSPNTGSDFRPCWD